MKYVFLNGDIFFGLKNDSKSVKNYVEKGLREEGDFINQVVKDFMTKFRVWHSTNRHFVRKKGLLKEADVDEQLVDGKIVRNLRS